MSGTHIVAIDQGTTGSRALVFGPGGRLIASAYEEFPQYFPRPGRVEHDAAEIWRSVTATLAAAIDEAGIDASEVGAVGITNQRETTVLWDRATLEPAARAIVWQDRRTAARCDELRGTPEAEMIRRKTGLLVDPYFSATKIEWLLASDPDLSRRAAAGELAFGTIDSWLIARLTGGAVHATDPTNASRTLLYSLDSAGWDSELCALFGVPEPLLPEIRSSAGDFGTTDAAAAGFEAPIAGVAGDQQAALFGQECWSAGSAKNTYGTGAFLLLHTGEERGPDIDGVLTTAACGPDGGLTFAYEGAILVAGAAIQWLRDGLGLIETAEESEDLAEGLDDAGGVVFVPALTGLGTPYWEPEARGAFFGLTRGTTTAHLVRAVLESMAQSTADVIEAMTGAGGLSLTALRVDGGAARNDWLMQQQADLIGHTVIRPEAAELTAIGAAGLAGVGSGLWEGAKELAVARGGEREFEPAADAPERAERRRHEWKRAVDAVLVWTRDGQRGAE
ncbi:MAG: glycerol kinase GlpK [Gemmatimonadota bacterium]